MPTVYIQSSVFLPTPSGGAGAVELLVWKMAEGLADRGWQVALFALEGSRQPPPPFRRDLPSFKHTISAQGGTPELREQALVQGMRACKYPPDVIFDHSMYMLAGMRKDIPYVAMSHGMAPLPSWAHNVVFTSNHHGKLHKARDPHALHLGIDLADIPAPSNANRRGLFWAGRILPYKRLHLACEIARRAGLPLMVAGPPTDEAYFGKVCRDYADIIDYRGAMSHTDVLAEMSRAKYVLFTSDETEPAGLVMLEAQACGTPVIALNDGSAHEYIAPNSGLIALSVDEAAEMALATDDWDKHSAKARDWIASRRTIEHMIDRAEEYLRAAMEGKRW